MQKADNRRTSEVAKFRGRVVAKILQVAEKAKGQDASVCLRLLALECERMPLYPWKS